MLEDVRNMRRLVALILAPKSGAVQAKSLSRLLALVFDHLRHNIYSHELPHAKCVSDNREAEDGDWDCQVTGPVLQPCITMTNFIERPPHSAK